MISFKPCKDALGVLQGGISLGSIELAFAYYNLQDSGMPLSSGLMDIVCSKWAVIFYKAEVLPVPVVSTTCNTYCGV